jgi:hypothetical protein
MSAVDLPLDLNAMQICCVPLILTEALVHSLLTTFVPDVDVNRFWQMLTELGPVIQGNEDERRLDRVFRYQHLEELEGERPAFAQQVHSAVLDYLEAKPHQSLDEEELELQRAYHTTPLDHSKGSDMYWVIYCGSRARHRTAMVSALARLVESQAHWLTDYQQEANLYRAAMLYYEDPAAGGQKAAELLELLLEQDAEEPVTIDALFLLGTLKEQTDRNEAARLYRQAVALGDDLDLIGKDPDVRRHLRLTLAKSLFNLASILQVTDGPQGLDEAERCYRRGIQIVAATEPGYEATQRRRLIQVLRQRGYEDKAKDSIQRLSQIESPFRQKYLEDALSKAGDLGHLYYAISALNHGLGYEQQYIRVAVEEDGSTQLEGIYTLSAMSMLSQIDTYLETVPESDRGVHFQGVRSLTPAFTVSFRRVSVEDPEAQRLQIAIDPPMRPGDQLTYRWTAASSPGTIATTPQELEEAGRDYEYVFWDIIAPMKHLKIEVLIPSREAEPPPPTWFELWRVGRWKATQTQTAYRASLKDDPSRVNWQVQIRPPDKLQLLLDADYPWLAMRYVLAWGIVGQSTSAPRSIP